MKVDDTGVLPDLRWSYMRQSRSDDWCSTRVIRTLLPDDWDPRLANAKDGQWTEIIRLAHEPVEFNGHTVPAFEGDLERIEWERKRSRY